MGIQFGQSVTRACSPAFLLISGSLIDSLLVLIQNPSNLALSSKKYLICFFNAFRIKSLENICHGNSDKMLLLKSNDLNLIVLHEPLSLQYGLEKYSILIIRGIIKVSCPLLQ